MITDERIDSAGQIDSGGKGIPSMRARLRAIGGRLDVSCRPDDSGELRFAATAWLPVRAGGR